MRIRIQQLKLMRIHADPDTDPDPKPWLLSKYGLLKNSDVYFKCVTVMDPDPWKVQNACWLLELNPSGVEQEGRIIELAAAFLSDLLAPLVDLFLGVGSLRLAEQPHHAQNTS